MIEVGVIVHKVIICTQRHTISVELHRLQLLRWDERSVVLKHHNHLYRIPVKTKTLLMCDLILFKLSKYERRGFMLPYEARRLRTDFSKYQEVTEYRNHT